MRRRKILSDEYTGMVIYMAVLICPTQRIANIRTQRNGVTAAMIIYQVSTSNISSNVFSTHLARNVGTWFYPVEEEQIIVLVTSTTAYTQEGHRPTSLSFARNVEHPRLTYHLSGIALLAKN